MEDKNDWKIYDINESGDSLVAQYTRQMHEGFVNDIIKDIKLKNLEKLRKKL